MANEPHADAPPAHHGPENPDVGHEVSDVNIKWILWFGAGLLALAVVTHLGLAWMFFAFKGAEEAEKKSQFPPEIVEGRQALPERPWLEQVEVKQRQAERPDLPPTKEAVYFGGRVRKGEVAGLPVEQLAERMAGKLKGREGVKWDEVGVGYPSTASSGRTPRSEHKPREGER